MRGVPEMEKMRAKETGNTLRERVLNLADWNGQSWRNNGVVTHLARVFVDAGAARDKVCALVEEEDPNLEVLLLALLPWDLGLERTKEFHADDASALSAMLATVVEQYAGPWLAGCNIHHHTVMWCSSIEVVFLNSSACARLCVCV
jgi:hypothetical protein